MSGAIVGATAGATAASHAAAAAARMREEEEELTVYNKDDMDGWEFKIIRSYQTYFKKPENLKKVCQEEAKAGWEMVEKFDDYRVRFKRRTDKRQSDSFLQGIDPYRTQVGWSSGRLVATILGTIFLSIGVILAIVFYFKSIN
jgi:hypothetical protein